MNSADSRADHPGSPLPDRTGPGWVAAGGLFLLLGFAVNAAVITAWLDLTLVWVDFLHHNPDRLVPNALLMLALSPIDGVLLALAFAPLAVLTGAIVLGCWVCYRALAKAPASAERAKLHGRILHSAAALTVAAIAVIAGASVVVHWKPWHPEVSWSSTTGLPNIAFENEWQTKIPSGFVSWSRDGTKILTLSLYSGWLTVQDPAGHVAQQKQLPIPFTYHFVVNAQEIILPGDIRTDVAFSVIDVPSGRTVFQEHVPQLNKPGLDQVTFALSQDGSVLAAAHSYFPGQPISLYDTRTWQKLSVIDVPAAQRGVGRLAFSADGSRLAFETSGNLVVVDARIGRPVSPIPIQAGAFALSPDNSMVAVEKIGSNPGMLVPTGIGIFRLSDGVQIASHAPPYRGPNCPENAEDCGLSSPILWAPTGHFLVFPDGYHTIRIWNPFAGKGEDATIQTRYFNGGIAFSPDAGWRSVTATSSAFSRSVAD